MECVYCAASQVVKNGTKRQQTGEVCQRYLCNGCGRRFNARSGTPMAGLRTPLATIEIALKARHEGLGVRAAGRVVGKSPNQITAWETRLSNQLAQWSPPAPTDGSVTIEGDEVYTRVGENLSPLGLRRLDD